MLGTPTYFFDSSAIVKRYHREPGTAWVQSICEPRDHPALYLSQLALVEVTAALRRVGRTRNYHPSFVDAMARQFERHITLSDPVHAIALYRLIPMSQPVLALAAELCNLYWQVRPYPLRSLDAIQLACAKAVAASISGELIFVTADTRLAAVAPLEGFHVVNPALMPQG